MAYTPIFVEKSKVISKINRPHITSISDEDIESAELRVILDLAEPIEPIGTSVSYQELLSCNTSVFQPLLEQAAMFATIAELNQSGIANAATGPITAASGDGMAKTQAYYSGKKHSVDILTTAEERYLRIVKGILRRYKSLCLGIRKNYKRYNPAYNHNYNINNSDKRKLEGNPAI
jgi:hypothetical protein